MGGGSYSWEKDIVGMWRLLKVNRCWESSHCREKTVFKTLGAAVPQKKIDRWYQHQQNMKFLRWWNWKFMRWSWIFWMLILTINIKMFVLFAEWMRLHNSTGLASTNIKKTWISGNWYSNDSIITVIHGKLNHFVLWSDFSCIKWWDYFKIKREGGSKG